MDQSVLSRCGTPSPYQTLSIVPALEIPLVFREHMVESFSFLLDVIAKDFHTILALIEPQQILDLSVHKHSISTESGGNVVIDISRVGA